MLVSSNNYILHKSANSTYGQWIELYNGLHSPILFVYAAQLLA